MGSKYRISPRRPGQRKSYIATFRDVSERQVTRSLATDELPQAELICAGLVWLHAHRDAFNEPTEVPVHISPRAVELFWGIEAAVRSPIGKRVEQPTRRRPLLERLPEPLIPEVSLLMLEREQLASERDQLREDLAASRREFDALRSTSLARVTEAASNCPPMAEALDEYARYMLTTATANHARAFARIARRFAADLPASVTTPAQLTTQHVGRWLDEQAATAPSPVVRRARHRTRIGRFVNWCAKRYGYPSVMSGVPSPTSQQLARERGEIQWHSLAEVEAAIELLPNAYWRALVATFAFSGLRLAELVWLRVSDIQQLPDGRRQLWITTVDDGHGERHELKSGHSRRAIEVHATRLWPLLERHLETGAGELFAFPLPPEIRRRARKSGHPERWVSTTLTRRLNGDAKNAPKLPEGMSARSLRRTFGSLLLRSGKSIAEVAAAMGNTPAVVQMHYARIIGAEVSVDF